MIACWRGGGDATLFLPGTEDVWLFSLANSTVRPVFLLSSRAPRSTQFSCFSQTRHCAPSVPLAFAFLDASCKRGVAADMQECRSARLTLARVYLASFFSPRPRTIAQRRRTLHAGHPAGAGHACTSPRLLSAPTAPFSLFLFQPRLHTRDALSASCKQTSRNKEEVREEEKKEGKEFKSVRGARFFFFLLKLSLALFSLSLFP